jgi:hypothetical protein
MQFKSSHFALKISHRPIEKKLTFLLVLRDIIVKTIAWARNLNPHFPV